MMENSVKPKTKKSKISANEEVEEMAQALYIYWKSRELIKTEECDDYEEANERAEILWKEETNEKVLDDFRKAAAVQIVMLGGEVVANRKRKQNRSEYGKNRAECNPFLLFCKDHKENVREKGSRGKGMTTLSNMWKDLPDSEKAKYIDIARENKAKELRTEADLVHGIQTAQPPEINQMTNVPLDVMDMSMKSMEFLPPSM